MSARKLWSFLLAAAAAFAGPVFPASAHSGGLDAQGCHHDRKKGGYHCHRAQTNSGSQSLNLLSPGGGDAYYPNCAAARAAGAAPLRRGEPGYRPKLDRDNDGIACE